MKPRVWLGACIHIVLTLQLAVMAKDVSVASQASMLIKTVEKFHYAPRAVNDSFSVAVYTAFLNMLDPHGLVLTREAVGRLEKYRFDIDDQIKQRKTDFLDTVSSLFVKQLASADSLLRDLADRDVDFSVKDTVWLGGDGSYSRQGDLEGKWARWIKYKVLWSMHRRADSTDTVPSQPSAKQIRTIAEEVISREVCRIQQKIKPKGGVKESAADCYLKAIARAFDPHTQYLSLADKRAWDTDLSKMSGLFGIHLNSNTIGEIEIAEMMPGGPAWRSNKINQGDVILDIRKADGTTMDLRCATIADVNTFLFSIGGESTEFSIRKKNGKTVKISLKKELLDVEENTIRSYVLKGKRAIGYIYLPSFYTDFTYADFFSKGCANDLAKELIKLKRASIDGLILDLRSNGGGSMGEAFRMAGVFIDHGALCISHSRGEQPEIVKDMARGVIYGGPLVVMVNAASASASELLVGVLQDYNRALVVGSRTYGKGTMQETLPVDAGEFDSLSRYKGEPPGFVKITGGTFYRVTGENHQKVGVAPDIALPDVFDDALDREASHDGVLAFAKIDKKTYYYPVAPLPINKLSQLSDKRVKSSAGFACVKRMAALLPASGSEYPVPLEYNSFFSYIDRLDHYEDSVMVAHCPFEPALPEFGTQVKTAKDSADNQDVIRSLREDIYINESFSIIHDLIAISRGKEEL